MSGWLECIKSDVPRLFNQNMGKSLRENMSKMRYLALLVNQMQEQTKPAYMYILSKISVG